VRLTLILVELASATLVAEGEQLAGAVGCKRRRRRPRVVTAPAPVALGDVVALVLTPGFMLTVTVRVDFAIGSPLAVRSVVALLMLPLRRTVVMLPLVVNDANSRRRPRMTTKQAIEAVLTGRRKPMRVPAIIAAGVPLATSVKGKTPGQVSRG
jgi:hypothetical protein